jgi:zinc transport system permease protein
MAIFACLIGIIAVVSGVYFSFEFDTPSGPTIVAALAAIFAILFPLSNFYRKN